MFLASASAPLVRFRHARAEQRQQLKWFAYAVGVLGFTLLQQSLLPGSANDLSGIVTAVAVWGIAVAIGIAVLRYRLYDIDRIINRTLVYGLLTALLGGVYAGTVLVLGQVFGGIGAQLPSWAVAGTTLFQPARRRIQQAVDRRFNRRRYNAAKTIQAFSTRLRGQIDLDTLSTELLAVVYQTTEPAQVSLWLRPAAQGSSATARGEARPTPWAY